MAATPSLGFGSSTLRAGSILAGKYALVRPLAEGGMGRVWTAKNLATGAEVAAKILLPEHAGSPEGLARFRREAEATATLSHRGIVRIFDLIELDPELGSLVMIMELLRGHTLAHHIEHAGKLSVAETLAVVLPLLSALSHAHALGIVHRDLKPENVFLAREPDGEQMTKLVDFGISKQLRESPITLEGQIVGTFRYMSPEQALGDDVDARSDIFSLGILLYECLSGANPFVAYRSDGTFFHRPMSMFDTDPAPLTDIPPALWQIIQRALAKRPEDRFETVADLAQALRREQPPAAVVVADARASTLPPPPISSPLLVERPSAATTKAPVRLRNRASAVPPTTSTVKTRVTRAAVAASAAAVVLAGLAWGERGLRASGSHAHAAAESHVVAATRLPHEKQLAKRADILNDVVPAPVTPAPSASPARGHLPKTGHPPNVFGALGVGLTKPAGPRQLYASRLKAGVVKDPGF